MPITEEQESHKILDNARTIAVVGLSNCAERPSHYVASFLHNCGYDIIPVNPFIAEFKGIVSVKAMDSIDVPIDIVTVFRRPEFAPDIARAAVSIGAGALWLPAGIVNDEAMQIAESGGLKAVQDICAVVTYKELGLI